MEQLDYREVDKKNGDRLLSHERTIRRFVQDIKDATGVEIRFRWGWTYWYLEDVETGSQYPLARAFRHVLSPEEQESICRTLHREEWLVLLGLNPPEEDD